MIAELFVYLHKLPPALEPVSSQKLTTLEISTSTRNLHNVVVI